MSVSQGCGVTRLGKEGYSIYWHAYVLNLMAGQSGLGSSTHWHKTEPERVWAKQARLLNLLAIYWHWVRAANCKLQYP